jgi:hypothetical protein
MTILVLLMLVPLGGLVVALARRRSFGARVTCVILALLVGAYSILNLIAAHRLAELHMDGKPPSAEWRGGVERMRWIVLKPVPLLLATFTALAVMALMPHRVALDSKDVSTRGEHPGS